MRADCPDAGDLAAACEVRFLYDLARLLGRSLGEVLDLPGEEIRGWSVYLNTLAEEGRR
jgi:hypothetical protein